MASAVPLAFAGDQAAIINYSVPLPSSHTGRRIVELADIVDDGDWTETARNAGEDLREEVGARPQGQGRFIVDAAIQKVYVESVVAKAARGAGQSPRMTMVAVPLAAGIEAAVPATSVQAAQAIPARQADVARYATVAEMAVARGHIAVLEKGWGGRPEVKEVDPATQGVCRLLLVEVYGISSFLGDYGMGRTVRTFSLLPGEETRISLKTWRSSEQRSAEASSIIDSQSEEAADRFAEDVLQETTDKSTQNSKVSWYVDAEVKASWGWGSAKVKGGASGESASSREEFARNVSNAVSEHSAKASSKRETEVTSSTERTDASGQETLTERTIRNVNMRRVLNFVFRELNQEYVTKTHLKDVRVAFTNGRRNTYREVPLSGLRGLLEDVLRPEAVDAAAAAILDQVGIVFDHEDRPVAALETVTMNPDGLDWTIATAGRRDGAFRPPTADGGLRYRFRRGLVGQEGASNPVEGVLVKQSRIVMRTDSVVIEALLGRAEALDEYAMAAQVEATRADALANQRRALLLEKVVDLPDGQAIVDALVELDTPCCGAKDPT